MLRGGGAMGRRAHDKPLFPAIQRHKFRRRGLAPPGRTRAWMIRQHDAASKRAPASQVLSRRCERLSLLYDVGDKNSGLGVARLTTRMRRFSRELERIA